MQKIVNATLTRCRDQKPLVTLDSEPFNGIEIRPADLLALAQQLTEIANLANILPTKGKHFSPTKVCLGLEETLAKQGWGRIDTNETNKGA